MLKRFLPIAGALALVIGIGTGCQDSQVSAPQSTTTLQTEATSSTFPAIGEFVNDADLIASFDDAMNGAPLMAPPPPPPDSPRGGGPRDTTRGGDDGGRGGRGHGGRDTARGGDDGPNGGGGRDTTRGGGDTVRGGNNGPVRPPCLQEGYIQRLLGGIRLTPEQAARVRACQQNLNDCVNAAIRRYNAARQDLIAGLRTELQRIQQAVQSGRITPAEGRRLWNAARENYRRQFAALQAGYIAALEHCCDEFHLCIRQAIGGGGREG